MNGAISERNDSPLIPGTDSNAALRRLSRSFLTLVSAPSKVISYWFPAVRLMTLSCSSFSTVRVNTQSDKCFLNASFALATRHNSTNSMSNDLPTALYLFVRFLALFSADFLCARTKESPDLLKVTGLKDAL